MKLGVVSDIHGNVEAMRTAMSALSNDVDEVLVAGDAFSDHRFSNEVITEIRDVGRPLRARQPRAVAAQPGGRQREDVAPGRPAPPRVRQ